MSNLQPHSKRGIYAERPHPTQKPQKPSPKPLDTKRTQGTNVERTEPPKTTQGRSPPPLGKPERAPADESEAIAERAKSRENTNGNGVWL